MKRGCAIKTDLFDDRHHKQSLAKLGAPLTKIEVCIDIAALAVEVDRIAPRPVNPQGGQLPLPTDTMVHILILKRLVNLSVEQMGYQLLVRMSYMRICSLVQATNILGQTTLLVIENQFDEAIAQAIFDRVSRELHKKDFIACGGQIIDATFVPVPKQHNSRGDKALIELCAVYADWRPVKRRRSNLDAIWTKNHGKGHHGYYLSVNGDKPHKNIRKIITDTASTYDSLHFDAIIVPANTSRDVYVGRGYLPDERAVWLKANGYRYRIQRTGHRNKLLTEAQQGRSHRIAMTCARVEHAFAAIEQMGGKLIRTIGQVRANFAFKIMAARYSVKRLRTSRGWASCPLFA